MAQRGASFSLRKPGWLVIAALTVAIGLTLVAGAPRQRDQTAEVWTVLVQTGDELAARQLTATLDGQPLTAGKAYLLAFHQAQDTGDLEHILAVADRLDAASEPDLATHVRGAADTLLEEIGGAPLARRPDEGLARNEGAMRPSRGRARTSGGFGSPAAGSRGGPWP